MPAPARRAAAKQKESLNKNNNKIRESVNVNETFTEISFFNLELEESVRVPVSFRIRDEVYSLYKRLGKSEKRLVRAILEVVIERVARGGVVRREGGNVIINMPISVALAKNEVKGTDEVLLKRLRNLERKLREYKQLVTEYEEEISRLRKEVDVLRKAKEELESRLRTSLPETVKRQVISDVKSVLYRLARQGLITRETLDIILKEIENLR